jgi:hypothetical protein
MTCAIGPKRRIFIGCPACDWVHEHDLRQLFDQRAIVASRRRLAINGRALGVERLREVHPREISVVLFLGLRR